MGTQVTAALDSDTKPNYTVATAAAAAVSVADGEFAIWAGDSVTSQVEAVDGLLKCCQALREAGWPNPITLELSAAVYDTLTHTLTVTNGIAPTLDVGETEVAVLQGLDFTVEHRSNSTHVRRMTELWLEDVAKAA